MKEINKKDVCITLSPFIIKYLKDGFYNRSKFIENCIIKELSKDDYFKNKINKLYEIKK